MGALSAPVLAAGLLAGLATGPASAASYYFSDCPSGGSGTQADPWCLTPTGQTQAVSFRLLADGVNTPPSNPELAPGDNVYLCAGACDGSGTGTYRIAPIILDNFHPLCVGHRAAFVPIVSGTATNPITIQSYPGETIIISGDLNNDNTVDAGDLDHMITTCDSRSNNRSWYVWKNLTFEKFKRYFVQGVRPFDNWVLDGIEFRYAAAGQPGAQTSWLTGDILGSGCEVTISGVEGYGFTTNNVTGMVLIQNSKFHHLCSFGTRIASNPNAASIVIQDSEFYNLAAASNDFQSKNVTYQRNYVHDCDQGLVTEDRQDTITIQDNTVACIGQYRLNAGGRCMVGIASDEGDLGMPGQTKNIIIRRNKVYGVGPTGGGPGSLDIGIQQSASCQAAYGCTSPGTYLIENNMVWNVMFGSNYPGQRAGIYVDTPTPVTIQNNTVYHNTLFGLSLRGASHIVKNNLLLEGVNSNNVRQPIRYTPSAAGSVFLNNNVFNYTGTAPVVAQYNEDLNDTTIVQSFTCAQVNSGSFGSGNICLTTKLKNISGSPTTWDLHLDPTDTANKDKGTAGATDDIDKQARTGVDDIGADELVTNDTTPPAPPRNVKVSQ